MKWFLFVLALSFVSCYKSSFNSRCASIPDTFIGNWKWEYINTSNTWQPLVMGAIQNIEINESTLQYPNAPVLNSNYSHLGCAIISGFSPTQNVYIEIENDTMIVTGLSDGIKWKLSKQ